MYVQIQIYMICTNFVHYVLISSYQQIAAKHISFQKILDNGKGMHQSHNGVIHAMR